jgi:BirA family biotin operon repressor/biotin-[acetyl-CoA-carboxylase] ligase
MIECEEWHLETRHIGRLVLVYDRVESTNTLAANLAAKASHDGTVILAREQTAGRGQHGRSWNSARGQGIWMSAILLPPPPMRRPVVLAALAAQAVCDTIQDLTGLPARIKWPNDVLMAGRKICGILIEQGHRTIIGIGLNLNQPDEFFQRAGLPMAASLCTFAGRTFECDQAARLLIGNLDRLYGRLGEGDKAGFESRWRENLAVVGKRVTVECHTSRYQGIIRAISFEGILLETEGGDSFTLLPEAIRHILVTN